MAGAALGGRCIRRTAIERAHTRKMLTRIQGAMDMTALAIPNHDEIIFVGRQFTLQSFLERVRFTSSETQKRDNNADGHEYRRTLNLDG